MASFDFAGARAAGASDDQIMGFLKDQGTFKFDYDGAVKAGATPTQIVDFLSKQQPGPTLGQDVNTFYQAGKQELQDVIAGKPAQETPETAAYLKRLGVSSPQDAQAQQDKTLQNAPLIPRLLTEASAPITHGLSAIQRGIAGLTGMAGSPVAGANRQFVSRPLSGATGIPMESIENAEGTVAGIAGAAGGLGKMLGGGVTPGLTISHKLNDAVGGPSAAVESLANRMQKHMATDPKEALAWAQRDIQNDLATTQAELEKKGTQLTNDHQNTLARAATGETSPAETQELRKVSPEAANLADEASVARRVEQLGQGSQGIPVQVGTAAQVGRLLGHGRLIDSLAYIGGKLNIGGTSNSIEKLSNQLVQRFANGGQPNAPFQSGIDPRVQQAAAMAQKLQAVQQQARQQEMLQNLGRLQAEQKARAAAQKAQQQDATQQMAARAANARLDANNLKSQIQDAQGTVAARQANTRMQMQDASDLTAARRANLQDQIRDATDLTSARRANDQMDARQERSEARVTRMQATEAMQQAMARRANQGVLNPDEIPNVLQRSSDIPNFLPPTSGRPLPPGPLTRDRKGRFQKRPPR